MTDSLVQGRGNSSPLPWEHPARKWLQVNFWIFGYLTPKREVPGSGRKFLPNWSYSTLTGCGLKTQSSKRKCYTCYVSAFSHDPLCLLLSSQQISQTAMGHTFDWIDPIANVLLSHVPQFYICGPCWNWFLETWHRFCKFFPPAPPGQKIFRGL